MTYDREPADNESPDPQESESVPRAENRGLPPPRFGLSTLLLGMAALSVIMALGHYLGSHYALLVVLFAFAIAAHVLGNSLGTRLRDGQSGSQSEQSGRPEHRVADASSFAPATRLRERSTLGRPILIMTIIGAILSGIAGSVVFAWLGEFRLPIVALILGGVAAATLGGMATFGACSFLQVAITAFWQATREPRKP